MNTMISWQVASARTQECADGVPAANEQRYARWRLARQRRLRAPGPTRPSARAPR